MTALAPIAERVRPNLIGTIEAKDFSFWYGKKQALRNISKGKSSRRKKPSTTRSRAVSGALKREGHSAASKQNLARQARSSARKRGAASRHQAAMKAVRTKGKSGLKQAAKKAAHARAVHRRAA